MKTYNSENEYRKRLQEFLKFLHRPPSQQELVAKNELGQNGLPISSIEMLLDELFFGLWEIAAFSYQTQDQSITATIELRVFHPVAKTWLCRTGVAAVSLSTVPIQTALPLLKASCLTNAALSLGKAFGRDLNRDYEEAYKPLVTLKVL